MPLVRLMAQEATSSGGDENAEQKLSILNNGLLQTDYPIDLRGQDGSYLFTNMTLEELRRLERQSRLARQLPAAAITQADIAVEVRGDVAVVEAVFTVQLGASSTPALVDLRMGTCRLSELPVKPEGVEQSLFQISPTTGSYQWLILGEAGSQHDLKLIGKVPLKQKSTRRTFNLDLPLAVTRLLVKLPANAVDERLRNEDLSQREEVGDRVQLDISSRGGDFSLTWREQGGVERVAAVEAETTTTFEIVDPEQAWSATTSLSLRAYGSDTGNRFRIRLPVGAQWRTYPSAEFDRYRISTLMATEEPEDVADEGVTAADEQRQVPLPVAEEIVVERIDPSSKEPIELLLEWEWLPADTAADVNATQVQIPVPEITGVDVLEGTVNCIFPAAYAAVFREGAGARLIQQGRLPNVFGRQQLQFQFDRQDFDLGILLRRERSLPTVRPTYKVNVDRHKLVLTAWFNCSFDTSRQQMEIGLIPGDWIIAENTARVLRDSGDPQSSEAEVLDVRRHDDGSYTFASREPETGFGSGNRRLEQVWRVVAERSWSADDNNALEFQIPVLVRGGANGIAEVDHGSGVLLVQSDNNIVTRWRETASTGLLPDSFSNEYQKFVSEARLREPLAYRFQSRGTTPTWAGLAEFLPQQISSEQHAIVEVLPNEVLIRQDFELRVANEPLRGLGIAVHASVTQLPQVFVDGNLASLQTVGAYDIGRLSALQDEPTVPTPAPREETEGQIVSASSVEAASQWREYQIVGIPNLIGAARLSVLTSIPWRATASADGGIAATGISSTSGEQLLDVPLARVLFPANTRFVRQDWMLLSDINLEVSSLDSMSAVESSMTATAKRRVLKDNQLSVPIRLRKRETNSRAAVSINGCWLQTVMSATERRDRFVAKLTSDSGKIFIRLPSSAQIQKVAIDGIPVEQSMGAYDYNTNTLSVTLPAGATEQSHVVEVFYFMDETLNWLSQLTIEPPVVVGGENLDRFCWQLIVPSMHHLAWSPRGLTAEWMWRWNGLWWHRQSGEDQAALERWLGSSAQTRQPLSANNYVMSGQGEFKTIEVRILSRFALWLPIGAVAILLAMLLLNAPRLRHPSVAVLAAGVIASLAMIWPDLAMLFGQTALIATSLIMLILVTQAAIDSRVRRRSVFTTRPSTHLEVSDPASAIRGSRPALPGPPRSGSSVVAVEER